MAAMHRHKAAGRRQSESRVRENRTHGLTRGCWGDHFKPVAYSTDWDGSGDRRFIGIERWMPCFLRTWNAPDMDPHSSWRAHIWANSSLSLRLKTTDTFRHYLLTFFATRLKHRGPNQGEHPQGKVPVSN